MLSSFTSFHKRKDSLKNDSEITPVPDPNTRPVHVIQDHKTIGVKDDQVQTHQGGAQVNAVGEIEPTPFDEVSLSTHSSYQQVPVETVIICNEEGKIFSGDDEFGLYKDDQKVDPIQGNPKQDQGKDASKETGDDDLSFNVDRDLLDGSTLDRALDDFKKSHTACKPKEEAGQEDGRTAADGGGKSDPSDIMNPSADDATVPTPRPDPNDSPNLVEDISIVEGNFHNKTFANIGKVMFKQQHDTQASKAPSTQSEQTLRPSALEITKELFVQEAKTKQVVKNKRVGMMRKIVFAATALASFVLYRIVNSWFKTDTNTDEPWSSQEMTNHQVCLEESFHYALYHMSTAAHDASSQEISIVQGNNIRSVVTMIFILIVYQVTISFYKLLAVTKGDPPRKMKEKKQTPRKRKEPKTPRSKPRIKRELNSLDKKGIFASTFSTEVVSPTGSIASVKRSSRIKSSSKMSQSKIEESKADMVKVDLFTTFESEPKVENEGMKLKVKAEKI